MNEGFATNGGMDVASRRLEIKMGSLTKRGSWAVPLAFSVAIVLAFAVVLTPHASAAVVHPFKETFGPVAQPSFTSPSAVAVDPADGSVLVVDAGTQTIRRFNGDGEPNPFTALGTNVIDAAKGPGGKPCAEEPASCDETPQNAFVFGAPTEVQVAVAPPGAAAGTAGNIYVTQAASNLIDIFGPDGSYVGQLTQYINRNEQQALKFTGFVQGDKFRIGNLPSGCAASTDEVEYRTGVAGRDNILNAILDACGPGSASITGVPQLAAGVTLTFEGPYAEKDLALLTCTRLSGAGSCTAETVRDGLAPVGLGKVCGVAVDGSGAVYVADWTESQIHKYQPSANPPVVADDTGSFGAVSRPCALTAGTGLSAGWLFATQSAGPLRKLDSETGAVLYQVAAAPIAAHAVDPGSGALLVASGNVATEYDVTGPIAPVELSTLTAASAIAGLSVAAPSGNVYVSRSGHQTLDVFGPAVSTPTVVTSAASEMSAVAATLNGVVNPEGTNVVDCYFEYGKTAAYGSTAPCAETVPGDEAPHPVSARVTGLEPATSYHVRLVVSNAAGPGEGLDRQFETDAATITLPPSSVQVTGATFSGSVNPAGRQLSECKFEYGESLTYGHSVPCTPAAAAIEPDYQEHAVSAAVADLQGSTTYNVRLVITTEAGVELGSNVRFTTTGTPVITEVRPAWVDQDVATLRANIDPSGFSTSYRFEWGPTPDYGRSAPVELDPTIPAGSGPVPVVAHLSGLAENTAYHFRVVATNSAGTSRSGDHVLRTLNTCGLPDDRCYELVSPEDKGAVGAVEDSGLARQLKFQVAVNGREVAYTMVNGLPAATTGTEVMYRAERYAQGWSSVEIGPPALIPSQQGATAYSGFVRAFGPDLSCSVIDSPEPLAPDAPLHPSAESWGESGAWNLFRRDRDGNFITITNRPITNESPVVFENTQIVGLSPDCNRVIIETTRRFQGIPGAGNNRLYEWDDGELRNVAWVPTPTGEAPVEGRAGSPEEQGNLIRAVSADASRTIFSAKSQAGDNVGANAVFVRIDGAETLDVTQSETAVPSNGARYEFAAADASRIFFTARAGLTIDSSPTGTDLYACRVVETGGTFECELENLSAHSGTQGAGVAGVLGGSEDGETVYFAARGQLVSERGRTFSDNLAANTYNVFRHSGSEVEFVGIIRDRDLLTARASALTGAGVNWASRSTPDGRHLLFPSSARVTRYDNNGSSQAYLYSADTGAVTCISCPADGTPSANPSANAFGFQVLPTGRESKRVFNPPSTVSDDGSRAYFYSKDALAPGGVVGRRNLYQWSEGQVALLATEPVGSTTEGANPKLFFAGGSADTESVFFTTTEQMSWEDRDGRSDLYVARVGGGFAEPPPPALPCDPLVEGRCTPPPASGPQPVSPGGSAQFHGPGNVSGPSDRAKKRESKKKKVRKKRRGAHRKKGQRKGQRSAKRYKGQKSAKRSRRQGGRR